MPFTGYRVTSPFGWRTHPIHGGKSFHTGIDLVKSHKAPINAFAAGEVLFAGMGLSGSGFGGYGIVVLIKDKNNRGQVYAHLDSVVVKKGEKVSKGQIIGYQGNTGQSTGSHLHFEVRKTCSPSFGWIADRANNCLEPTAYLRGFVNVSEPNTQIASNIVVNTLKKGDRGASVTSLQNKLITKGYKIKADGIFGDETLKAVKQFQKDNKLSVDGLAGIKTMTALNKTASTGSSIVPYPGTVIKAGSRGKDVERIQRAVNVKADGIFGKQTENAVKAYQKRHGLVSDGKVGPATWKVMF